MTITDGIVYLLCFLFLVVLAVVATLPRSFFPPMWSIHHEWSHPPQVDEDHSYLMPKVFDA